MPEIGSGDVEKSTATFNDNSGLIIYKHHSKNKKSINRTKSTKSSMSKSFDTGLNHKSLVDYNEISPKYVSSKFAHPISTRDASFYKSPSKERLLELEKNFNIDCVAVTFQRYPRGQNIYEPYNPIRDEHCQRYFQSPIVLDVLKRTMPEITKSLKRVESKSSLFTTKDDLNRDDPIFNTVRSSNYHLLVPYPYNSSASRATTVMSRRSQLKTGKSAYTDGYFSLISSRQSSKATNYVDRSATTNKKSSPESIRFPPITSTMSNADSVGSKKSIKTKKRVHINESDNQMNNNSNDAKEDSSK